MTVPSSDTLSDNVIEQMVPEHIGGEVILDSVLSNVQVLVIDVNMIGLAGNSDRNTQLL